MPFSSPPNPLSYVGEGEGKAGGEDIINIKKAIQKDGFKLIISVISAISGRNQ